MGVECLSTNVEPTDDVRLVVRDLASAAPHATVSVTVSISKVDEQSIPRERLAAIRHLVRQQDFRNVARAAAAAEAIAAASAAVPPLSPGATPVPAAAMGGRPLPISAAQALTIDTTSREGANRLHSPTEPGALVRPPLVMPVSARGSGGDAARDSRSATTKPVAPSLADGSQISRTSTPPMAEGSGSAPPSALTPQISTAPAPISVTAAAATGTAGTASAPSSLAPLASSLGMVSGSMETELARLLVGRLGVRGCARLPDAPGTVTWGPMATATLAESGALAEMGAEPLSVSSTGLVPAPANAAVGGAQQTAAARATAERYEIHLGQRAVSAVPVIYEFSVFNQGVQPVEYRIRTLRESDKVSGENGGCVRSGSADCAGWLLCNCNCAHRAGCR